MPRAFRFGNYGVYVLSERGQRHHLPHAHVKHGRRRVAAFYLLTLTIYDELQVLGIRDVPSDRRLRPSRRFR
jgi:hypothetical protein